MTEREAMIKEFTKNTIELDGKFSFRCDQCGECCRDRNDILLTPYDLYYMAKHLKCSIEEIVDKYGHCYVGQNSNMPLISLQMREDNGYCPFLNAEKKCDIHANKPVVCALYPLGRGAKRNADEKDEANLFYFLQPINCGFRDEVHTPREWIGAFKVANTEKWFMMWQDIVIGLSTKLENLLPKLPGKTADTLMQGLFGLLYVNYDLEQPVIPQAKSNGEHALELIAELTAMLTNIG